MNDTGYAGKAARQRAEIERLHRQQRWARRRTALLLWTAGWFVAFFVVFAVTVPI